MSFIFDVDGRPSPLDFELYVTYACNQLMADIDLNLEFNKSLMAYPSAPVTASKNRKKGEIQSEVEMSRTVDLDKKKKKPSTSNNTDSFYKSEINLVISTVYDHNNYLIKIKFEKKVVVPRALLKIIGMILPFHPFVTTISFVGGMAAYTLHELKNILPPLSNITDICLDGTFFPEANFELLLEDPTNIVYLSIARCCINDEVVRRIFLRIKTGQAATTLSVLNLACNRITDVGMSYIADALRTNRQLCYLNVSANKFTDDGALMILDVLKLFSLTQEEVVLKRSDCFKYLINIQAARDKATEELAEPSKLLNVGSKKSIKSVKSIANKMTSKLDNTDDSLLADFEHVFSKKNIEIIDNVVHCFGNTVLCVLNLAYNNLSFLVLKKILEVVQYQSELNKRPLGLLHVNIEGNYMPEYCKELILLQDILESQGTIMSYENKKTKSNSRDMSKKKIAKSSNAVGNS